MKTRITLQEIGGYSIAILSLMLAGSIYAYRVQSDRVLMEKVYNSIVEIRDGATIPTNPLRLSANEEGIFVRLYPYQKTAGDFLYAKLQAEKDLYRKEVILKLLPGLGCTDCTDELESYLHHEDQRITVLAVTALHKMDHVRIRELLHEIIEKNEGERMVPWAIYLLSERANQDDYVFISSLASKPVYQSVPMQKAIGIALAEMQKKGIGVSTEEERNGHTDESGKSK